MKNNLNVSKKSGKSVSTGTYAILFLALGAMTFFGVCSPQGQVDGLRGPAGSVASESISNGDFVRAYERQSQQMRSQYGENYDPRVLKVADRVLDQLISQRILYLKAQQLGLTATEDEVVRELTTQLSFTDESGKFSEEYFRRFLRNNAMTEQSLMDELRRYLTMQKLQQLITESVYVSNKEAELDWRLQETKLALKYIKIDPNALSIDVSKDERDAFLQRENAMEKVKAWYEGHLSDFRKPEQVHARHILKSYKGARNAATAASGRSKEEARIEAERLLDLARAKKTSFAELAKRETDEPQGKKNGGDLGFFSRESMVKEFSDVAFALGKGEVSKVVETPFGYHVIKVIDRRPAVDQSLEEATSAIVDTLIRREKAPAQAEALAAELLAQAGNTKSLDALLKKHALAWQETGEFALNARYIPGLGAKQEIVDQVFSLVHDDSKKTALVKAQPNFFVVNLVDFKPANPKGLDKDQLTQLRATATFSQGYGFFAEYEAKARREFEQKKVIYKNPAYLALDQPQASS